jgi:hypothetical protein
MSNMCVVARYFEGKNTDSGHYPSDYTTVIFAERVMTSQADPSKGLLTSTIWEKRMRTVGLSTYDHQCTITSRYYCTHQSGKLCFFDNYYNYIC